MAFAAASSGCRLTLHECGVHLDGDDSEGDRVGWSAMLDALADHLARDAMPGKGAA